MTPPPIVAFHAPLKPPDHPVPSGDRTVGRHLLAALDEAGLRPEIASTLRSFQAEPDPLRMAEVEAKAEAEVRRLLDFYGSRRPGERPRLWLTYHLYYKSPDLIGPAVSSRLSIPYVVAEGSRAPKRRVGPWSRWNALAEAALDRADLHLVLNPNDREMLEAPCPSAGRLASLPPFIDPREWPAAGADRRAGRAVSLLAVAMMRDGDKLASYRLLADSLGRCMGLDWTLGIVGDGPARAAVEAFFAPLGARVQFHGQVVDRDALSRLYAGADLLVWPAVNEAFGMVFLEAAVHGCPAVAGDFGGVGGVVSQGRSGILVRPGDAGAFAEAVARLIADPAHRSRLSREARQFVSAERSLAPASQRLKALLAPLLAMGDRAA
jgi:glycosyltransferase involved in cell wall biosynthesis